MAKLPDLKSISLTGRCLITLLLIHFTAQLCQAELANHLKNYQREFVPASPRAATSLKKQAWAQYFVFKLVFWVFLVRVLFCASIKLFWCMTIFDGDVHRTFPLYISAFFWQGCLNGTVRFQLNQCTLGWYFYTKLVLKHSNMKQSLPIVP